MIKKTLKHFGALGFALAMALSLAPASMQAQDGRWNRGYNQQQQRDWNRYQGRGWRDNRRSNRDWRAWDRNRDWRRQQWRNDRFYRRYQRGYVPGRSFYFGYRY